MIQKKSNFNNERDNISPKSKYLTIENEYNSKNVTYSLNKNFFDPSKSSPPNEFMIKLHKRMNIYDYLINEDKRDSE